MYFSFLTWKIFISTHLINNFILKKPSSLDFGDQLGLMTINLNLNSLSISQSSDCFAPNFRPSSI
jgi:hypothetical protein